MRDITNKREVIQSKSESALETNSPFPLIDPPHWLSFTFKQLSCKTLSYEHKNIFLSHSNKGHLSSQIISDQGWGVVWSFNQASCVIELHKTARLSSLFPLTTQFKHPPMTDIHPTRKWTDKVWGSASATPTIPLWSVWAFHSAAHCISPASS